MARKGDFTPNEFVEVDGVWCMAIMHKGSLYYVKIDEEDIPKISKHRWYINSRKGMLYCLGRVESRDDKQYLHRFLIKNAEQVDHRNGDTLDNRKSNLRACNNSINSMNKTKQKNNKIGYKNIVKEKDRNKYRVQIVFNGNKYDKRFDSLEEAIEARNNIYKEWNIPCEREID